MKKAGSLPLLLSALLLTAAPGFAADLPPELANLAEAVRLRTISHQDPGRFEPAPFLEFHRLLRRAYPRVHDELEVVTISDYSLLYKWQGSDPSLRPVLVDAHYDVVPVEPGTEGDWDFAPFSGEVRDGYLLGRGALDDKSPAMATFEGLERLLAEGYGPARTLYYSLGHDEETGGNEGAAKIVDYLRSRGVTFEFMLGEGGMVLDSYPVLPGKTLVIINLAQKGYITLTLATEGDGGHSSAPVADNSLVRLAEAVSKLHNQPFEPRLVSPVSDMLAVLGRHAGGLTGFAMRNQWLMAWGLLGRLDADPLTRPMVRTTTAVTMFNSGVKENVIPQRAEARVNFRLLPGDTRESLIAAVAEIIDDPEVSITADDWEVNPRVADMSGPGYLKVAAAVARTMPEAIVAPGLLIASTDTVHYRQIVDQVYHFQPFFTDVSDARGVHGTNERVSVAGYLQSIDLARAVLRSITAP